MLTHIKKNWPLFLFALPFAGVGVGVLLLSVLPSLMEWQSMKSWREVDAHLLQAELTVNRSDDSNTYEARARYRYSFAGLDYESKRVAITSGSDNVGDFQERLGARLTSAYKKQHTVTAWVNPENPTQAILNRDMRWGLLWFKMIFVLVFGGVGCGLIAWVFLGRAGEIHHPECATKPWLVQPEWASEKISGNAKTAVWGVWGFALLWNAISSFLWFVIPSELAKGNYVIMVAILFPLVGLGLLYWAISTTLEWRRFGALALHLDPYPGSIGGQVGGQVDIPLAYSSAYQFPVTLACAHSYMSGSGKDRSRKESIKWQAQGFAYAEASATGTRLNFRFDVPEKLSPSEPASDNYHRWRLIIKASLPGIDLNRQFDIPVYPTAEKSQHLLQDSGNHPHAIEYRNNLLEAVLDMRQVQGGVEIYYPMFRHAGMKLGWMLFGIIFGGVGIGISYGDAPGFMVIIFTLIGIIIFLVCLYSLFSSLRVRLDQEGLWTRRQLFGVIVSKQHYQRTDIKLLTLKQSYSMQSGSEHVEVFSIKAHTNTGKKITIGESLKGRETALQALEAISLLSGYPKSDTE